LLRDLDGEKVGKREFSVEEGRSTATLENRRFPRILVPQTGYIKSMVYLVWIPGRSILQLINMGEFKN